MPELPFSDVFVEQMNASSSFRDHLGSPLYNLWYIHRPSIWANLDRFMQTNPEEHEHQRRFLTRMASMMFLVEMLENQTFMHGQWCPKALGGNCTPRQPRARGEEVLHFVKNMLSKIWHEATGRLHNVWCFFSIAFRYTLL